MLKRLYLILTFLTFSLLGFSKEYKVYGPQGGLAMEVTLAESSSHRHINSKSVILQAIRHGSCSPGCDKNINDTPMPEEHQMQDGEFEGLGG